MELTFWLKGEGLIGEGGQIELLLQVLFDSLKLSNELSLQASSDPTSDIGIVSFSFSIYCLIYA